MLQVFQTFDQYDASGPSRPVVRMNRPQWVSLRFPQGNGGEYGSFTYGSLGNSLGWASSGFTLPVLRSVSSADRLHRTFTLKNSACSEMLQNARPFVSGCAATLQLPRKPVYQDDLDDVFLPDTSHITPLRAENQRTLWGKRTIQRTSSQHGDAAWTIMNMPPVLQDNRQMQETMRRQPSVGSTHTTMIATAQQQEATADMLR